MRLFAGVFLLLISLSAKADFVGIFAGGGYWNANFSGDVISGVSVENDLGIDSSSSAHVYVAFEHPVPVLPNIKLAHTTIKDSGVGTLTRDFVFNNDTFTTSQVVNTQVDLTHTDFTLYYEIIDIGMDIDVGLTGRYFQGDVAVNGTREDLNVLLPMLYGHAKFGLPFTGTYISGDINYVGYSGNQLADITLAIGWEMENFILPELGIEGGYRRFSIDADADDLDVNIDTQVDGVFVQLTGHF